MMRHKTMAKRKQKQNNSMNQQSKMNTPVEVKGAVDAPRIAPPVPKPAPKPLPKGMKHDKDLLLDVFHIQNPSRNKACNDHAMETITSLAPAGCTVIRKAGNLLIRKGPAEGPHPHYLAHMDQVHDYEPFMKVILNGNIMSAVDGNEAQCGVGGDDKCGIYLALRMLHVLDHCTAVFVRDEEVGCLGSEQVPLSWFKHAAFVIQADRNNQTMDLIRETNGMLCASDEFMAAVSGLPIVCAAGHKPNTGSITDVGELSSRGLAISMINISSGYHNPHSKREIVLLDQLGITCQLAFEAASLLGNQVWAHEPESQYFTRGSRHGSGYGRYNSAWDTDDWSPITKGSQTYEEMVEDNDAAADTANREWAINELTVHHGYDRDFDCLDSWITDDLLELVDECEDRALGIIPKKK
jgi:hypothetical protein